MSKSVSFCGMWDDCSFSRYSGQSLEDILANWRADFSPFKSMVGGEPSLCPVIVMDGGRELRRVGEMVHDVADSSGIEKWILACATDPDICRILAETE